MKKLGQKAESLTELKKKGLFKQNLLILRNLPPKDKLFAELLDAGFTNGDRMGVRFSSANRTINLPRSVIIKSFEEIYQFISEKITPKLVAIVQGFVTAKYSGTFVKNSGIYYMSIINGVWESESAKSCDNVIISGSKAKMQISVAPKTCLFENGSVLEKRIVRNNPEDLIADIKNLWQKIKKFDWDDDILYEFFIMPDGNFTIMEFKKTCHFSNFNFDSDKHNLFEVESFADLRSWNGKQDILLLTTLARGDDETEFFRIINKIKEHKNLVYVKYGICSHPAIILREQGLKAVPYSPSFKIFEEEI
ncbi:MAG: hypothetical protein WC080_04610 [Patescibacteria group bacterium]|jgi:hypothetical protein